MLFKTALKFDSRLPPKKTRNTFSPVKARSFFPETWLWKSSESG